MGRIFLTILLTGITGIISAQKAAPDFLVDGEWFNSNPITIDDLKGQVVLVEMWTFACYNCYRSKPTLIEFYEQYQSKGLEIIGVHTPEFNYEKVAENVRRAIAEHNVTWPVFQDNEFRTWRAFGNRAWPTFYLIDRQGNIRYSHRGELSDKFPRGIQPLKEAIEELLNEAP